MINCLFWRLLFHIILLKPTSYRWVDASIIMLMTMALVYLFSYFYCFGPFMVRPSDLLDEQSESSNGRQYGQATKVNIASIYHVKSIFKHFNFPFSTVLFIEHKCEQCIGLVFVLSHCSFRSRTSDNSCTMSFMGTCQYQAKGKG